jgi:hypothetical protein
MVLLFGYVRPQKSELLVREYEEYGGIYCTLCRRLGKDYGVAARLALSYDGTFYALLLLSVSEKSSFDFFGGRCVANPLKKCLYCPDEGPEFASASALTVILTYFKIRDDIEDSGFWRSLSFRLVLPIASRARKKAAKRYPQMDKAVFRSIQLQEQIEHQKFAGIDACAEPTAEMLAEVFELAARERDGPLSPRVRVFHQFGYYLGRWTYLMDAADDLEADIQNHSFNPFVQKFQLDLHSHQQDLDRTRSYVNQTLNGTLAKLGAAADLLDCNQFGSIIRNVVSKGLPQMQKERLFKKETRNVRSL